MKIVCHHERKYFSPQILSISMKKVLITGITGMVGSHLADFLLENTDFEILPPFF